MSQVLLQWETWIYGLFAGFIGGGANAVVTSTVISAMFPATFSASAQLHNFLVLVGITFVSSGILSAMMYLQKSPLPAIVTTTTDKTIMPTQNGEGVKVTTVETTEKS